LTSNEHFICHNGQLSLVDFDAVTDMEQRDELISSAVYPNEGVYSVFPANSPTFSDFSAFQHSNKSPRIATFAA